MLIIDQNRNPFQSTVQSTSSTFATDGGERADNIPWMIQGSTYHDDPLAQTDRSVVDSQLHGAGDDRGIRISPDVAIDATIQISRRGERIERSLTSHVTGSA